jgi:Gametolysin peptidase M11
VFNEQGMKLLNFSICCIAILWNFFAVLHPLAAESPKSPAKIALVIVEFPGIESGLDVDLVKQTVFGPQGVANRFYNISKSKFQLVPWKTNRPSVFGPIIVKKKNNESCDDSYRKWSERALAQLGKLGEKIDDNVDHLVFLFPPAELLGCKVRARGELLGYRSWIFSFNINTIIHEISHNLGLAHSATGDLSNISDEYGDRSSPMGYPSFSQVMFNAPQLAQLGWMDSNEVFTISDTGSYDLKIRSLEQSVDKTLPNAIQINTKAPARSFFVSYRDLADSTQLGMNVFTKGLSIHYDQGYSNMTILTSTLSDGEIFFDQATGLKIIQVSRTRNEARLMIILPTSQFSNISVSVTPPEHDLDGDGVSNDLDCEPEDSTLWTNQVTFDSDKDGIPDNDSPVSSCYGSQVPEGMANLGVYTDNCPNLASLDRRDTNWDGVGDSCSVDNEQANKRYLQAASLRQLVQVLSFRFEKNNKEVEKLVFKCLDKLLKTAIKGPYKISDSGKIKRDAKRLKSEGLVN